MKFTPFTTRPAVTSKQGMILLAKGISGLAERLVGGRLRRLEIELPLVQRAAGDRSDDALRHELGADRLDVGDAGEPPGGDDRRFQRLRELQRGLDVDRKSVV